VGAIVSSADGALGQISDLLIEVQGLVVEVANTSGLTSDEIDAKQSDLDSILRSINSIAKGAQFGGKKLLDGQYAYTLSTVNATNVASLNVYAARVPTAGLTATIAVTQSAQTGTVGYTGGTLAGGNAISINVTGNLGTETIELAGGTTVAAMVTAINAAKDSTGVSASTSSSNLRLSSTGFGKDQFVSVSVNSGTFVPTAYSDTGRDATVTVNGRAADVRGKRVIFRSDSLDAEFTIGNAINTSTGAASFKVLGGGATFSVSATASNANKLHIALPTVNTATLATAEGALASLSGGQANALTGSNLTTTQQIVDGVVQQVSRLRARLGGFQSNTVEAMGNVLQSSLESVSGARSALTDLDTAAEVQNLTRAQLLSDAAASVLATIQANQARVLGLVN